MDNKERLRKLINLSPGETWDKKVVNFATANGRSRSSCYRWLDKGPPPNVLDAIEFRMYLAATVPSEEARE